MQFQLTNVQSEENGPNESDTKKDHSRVKWSWELRVGSSTITLTTSVSCHICQSPLLADYKVCHQQWKFLVNCLLPHISKISSRRNAVHKTVAKRDTFDNTKKVSTVNSFFSLKSNLIALIFDRLIAGFFFWMREISIFESTPSSDPSDNVDIVSCDYIRQLLTIISDETNRLCNKRHSRPSISLCVA